MHRWLVLALTLVMAASAGYAADESGEIVLAEISTRGGKVILVEEGNERRFVFKEEVLQTGTEFLDVYRFFRPRTGYDGLLVRDFTGPIHCPARFRLLVFKPGGAWFPTPYLDHCDATPESSLDGKTITIRFDAFGSMPAETWTFDGKTLKKGKPANPAP